MQVWLFNIMQWPFKQAEIPYPFPGRMYDRALGKVISAFGLTTWYRNPFAGVATRWAEGAGLAFRAVQQPHDTLRLEVSLSANQERSVAGVRNSFAATRGAAAYRHAFNGKAVFTEGLELVSNLKDTHDERVNSETALAAPISRSEKLVFDRGLRHHWEAL